MHVAVGDALSVGSKSVRRLTLIRFASGRDSQARHALDTSCTARASPRSIGVNVNGGRRSIEPPVTVDGFGAALHTLLRVAPYSALDPMHIVTLQYISC